MAPGTRRIARPRRTGVDMRALLLAALLCAAPLFARSAPATDDPAAVATIRQLEEALTQAFNSLDAEALARLWDDEFVVVWPNGVQHDKRRRLAALKTRPANVPQSANESMQIKVLGDAAVAIVVTRWTDIDDGQPVSYRTCTTRVWARRGDRWALLSAHVSALDP